MFERIINFTPHDVVLLDDKENVIHTFKPQKRPVRMKTGVKTLANFNGVPVKQVTFGEANLPQPYKIKFNYDDALDSITSEKDIPSSKNYEGKYYIVSALVATRHPERKDFLMPHDIVRDKKGVVLGCKSFAVVAWKSNDEALQLSTIDLLNNWVSQNRVM